jgi:excinuclease ABC subunit C
MSGLVLSQSLSFDPAHDEAAFAQIPATQGVFLLRGHDATAEPYASKAADMRRRIRRLLAPAEAQSKRLNLRERVAKIEFQPTGSDFEAGVLLYNLLRHEFPGKYRERLRLRPAALIKLDLENEYPRAYVTRRLGKLDGRSLFYGPFPSLPAAEKYLNDVLDVFKTRRCTFNLSPDPAFPGCVYSEMKMCLAPCFKGCTDEAYATEIARLQQFLDSAGESLISELAAERERASEALDFEGAAAVHARIEKLKSIGRERDEIVRRVHSLDAAILQRSLDPEAIAVFRFCGGQLLGPVNAGAEAEPLQAALAQLQPSPRPGAAASAEQLAIIKRWYYRSSRVGEMVLRESDVEWSARKLVNAARRLLKQEMADATQVASGETSG